MKDPAPKFWDTCFSTPITACVTFEVGFNDQFSGRWRTDLFKTSEPIRITAWGLKFPGKAELNISFGDAAWNAGNPLDFGWNDFPDWPNVFTGALPIGYVVEFNVPEPSAELLLLAGGAGTLCWIAPSLRRKRRSQRR